MNPACGDATESKNKTLLGFLLLVAFLAYANTLTNGFVYDDHSQIEQNPYLHSFRNVRKIFGTSLAVGNYYRPLVNFDFLLSFRLFGSSPLGFHLVSALLNCIAVWLVYEVTAELTSDQTFGLVTALCFAIHPVHTESVNWIADTGDLEMAIFYLSAFWLFVHLGGTKGRTVWIQAAMLGSFWLAMLAKEPGVTLPAVATVYEHCYRADRPSKSWKQKAARYGGFWAMGVVYCWIRITVLGGFAPQHFHPDIGWREAALTMLYWIGQYAAKLVWPVPLTVFYPLPKGLSLFDPRVLAGAAVLLGGAAFLAYDRKRARIYSFALVWILLTLSPVLNVRWIPLDVFAERYLYLPSVGFCWLVAGAGLWLWRKSAAVGARPRWALTVGAGILGLLACGEILARNRDWKDDHSLAQRTVQTNPDCSNMRSDLAMAEWRADNRAEAIHQWQLALAYRPDSLEALSDLGFAMNEERRYAEAISFLEKAIELGPHFATPHVHLAHVYEALGKNMQAEAELRSAVGIYPMSPFIRNALGHFYLTSGRAQQAELQFQASVAIVDNDDGWSGLAEAYTVENIPQKAAEAWRRVLTLEPFDSHAHLSLARIYLANGLSDEAAREFERCLYTDPNNEEARGTLDKLRPQEKRP